MDRRTITPASFEKENVGRGNRHAGIEHSLQSFRQHPAPSSFELPLGSIPDKMNYASLPLQPHHSGTAVGVAQPQVQQVVTATTAPVHLDHQLAAAVSGAYPQSYHHHHTGAAVSYIIMYVSSALSVHKFWSRPPPPSLGWKGPTHRSEIHHQAS
jgi:hypothetical protein